MNMVYKIIKSLEVDELTKLVNKSLKKGWELKGSVKVVSGKNYDYGGAHHIEYLQTMIKKKSNE